MISGESLRSASQRYALSPAAKLRRKKARAERQKRWGWCCASWRRATRRRGGSRPRIVAS